MSSQEEQGLLALFDEARLLTAPLISLPDAVVEPDAGVVLEHFSELARGLDRFKVAGEIARSLASLLMEYEGQFIDETLRVQISALYRNLLEAMNFDGQPANPESPSQLVTPVPASARRNNNQLAIYLADSAPTVVIREAAVQAGFTSVVLNSLRDLEQFTEANYPAAILVELGLIEHDRTAPEIFADLRRRLDPAPHLFFIGKASDIPGRLAAVRLGATRFIASPPDIGRLISVLKGVTAQTPAKPYRVLLIDDDELLGELYKDALSQAGIEIRLLHDPLQAPYQAATFEPDVIVSDLYMPGCNGLELLAVLRQDDTLVDTPVIFLSSENDPLRQIEAIDMGADDFLAKPVSLPLLAASVVARAKRSRRLKRSHGEFHRLHKALRELEAQRMGNAGPDDVAERVFPEALSPTADSPADGGKA